MLQKTAITVNKTLRYMTQNKRNLTVIKYALCA